MRKDSENPSSRQFTITIPVHCQLARVRVKVVEKFDRSKETIVDRIDENGEHLAVIHGDTGHFDLIGPLRSDSMTGVLTNCPWCDPLD